VQTSITHTAGPGVTGHMMLEVRFVIENSSR